jgi:hypothetical protein
MPCPQVVEFSVRGFVQVAVAFALRAVAIQQIPLAQCGVLPVYPSLLRFCPTVHQCSFSFPFRNNRRVSESMQFISSVKVVREVVNQSLYAIAQAKQEHHNQQQFNSNYSSYRQKQLHVAHC